MSVLSRLKEVKINIGKIRQFLPEGESLFSRTESAYIELDDLAFEVDKLAISIEADPQRLNQVNDRLDQLYSLIQKHRVADLTELIAKKEEISKLIKSIVTSDEKFAELESLIEREVIVS
jgi:DNA repair protein RecN (Recombination protein N)